MEKDTLETPLEKPKKDWLKISLAVLGGLVLLGTATYTGYRMPLVSKLLQYQHQLPKSGPAPIPKQPTPSPSVRDETADWRTYANTKYGYSIKLPPDWGEWSIETGSWKFSREIGQSDLVLLGDYEGPPTKTAEGIIIVPQKLDVAVHLNASKSDWIGGLQKPEGECSETLITIGEQRIQASKVLCPGFHSVTYLIEKGRDLYRITKGKEFAEFDFILSTFKFLE